MNRHTVAFLKYNLEIKYKKGSEMPVDSLSRNVDKAAGPFDDNILGTTAQQEDE